MCYFKSFTSFVKPPIRTNSMCASYRKIKQFSKNPLKKIPQLIKYSKLLCCYIIQIHLFLAIGGTTGVYHGFWESQLRTLHLLGKH